MHATDRQHTQAPPPPPPLMGLEPPPLLGREPLRRVIVGYRYRLRWENILAAIATVILLVVFFQPAMGLVGKVLPDGQSASDTAAKATAPAAAADGDTMTAARELELITQAQLAMEAGDFQKARELLLQVDTDQASQLRDENAENERQYLALSDEILAAVKARKWTKARASLTEIREFGPLTAELEKAEGTMTRQLAIAVTLKKVHALHAEGKLRDALAAAETGYSRFSDARLKQAIADIRKDIKAKERRARAVSGSGSTGSSGGNNSKQSDDIAELQRKYDELERRANGNAGGPPNPDSPPPA